MEYRLTIKQLERLCRDFQADCFDGFVSNDRAYIELWLDKNLNIKNRDNVDSLGEPQ